MNRPSRSFRGQRTITLLLATCISLALLAACRGPSDSASNSLTATSPATAAGGSAATLTSTAPATATPAATATSAATPTPAPTGTSVGTATVTTAPAATATPLPDGSTGEVKYLDDRSTAAAVIDSYYRAINAKQYARAYSYWEPNTPADQLPPFDQFQQGYATTTSVQVTIGDVGGGAAAGNLYFSVPVMLQSATTDKGDETFVGCYTLHIGNPANQTEPPFESLAIQKASVTQVTGEQSAKDLLDTVCADQGSAQPPQLGTPSENPNDISADRYLDDRTNGVEELRSYYNAINRKEYARAYGYWEPNTPADQLPAFNDFRNGYADTASVALTVGAPVNDAGAGQLYTSIPATIVATMTDGSTQTFVGCYTTHLAQPTNQAEPPFHPLGFQRANVGKVDNSADTATLMASVCKP
ncbi:MAG TPA: hypothetical protein VF201_11345 [Nitrolancea sp.]